MGHLILWPLKLLFILALLPLCLLVAPVLLLLGIAATALLSPLLGVLLPVGLVLLALCILFTAPWLMLCALLGGLYALTRLAFGGKAQAGTH